MLDRDKTVALLLRTNCVGVQVLWQVDEKLGDSVAKLLRSALRPNTPKVTISRCDESGVDEIHLTVENGIKFLERLTGLLDDLGLRATPCTVALGDTLHVALKQE